ncbi:hypothetical protein PoB_005909300 [Plakobranchus ocellatus]|uniref:Uncharacterized protein n=1 Tax=Plakobranchus ocellatus TaxID=259542 RepID=A0AAV4CKN9_9GAST|nr:hypothetical protein PoB_005909300 [Plakobranchus ocellatus]
MRLFSLVRNNPANSHETSLKIGAVCNNKVIADSSGQDTGGGVRTLRQKILCRSQGGFPIQFTTIAPHDFLKSRRADQNELIFALATPS